ncbi:MAG: hypothetical protein OXG94_00365 [Bacteroidetes bacterium]|nr:hypothetical protein [Bacteroidota bacterium]
MRPNQEIAQAGNGTAPLKKRYFSVQSSIRHIGEIIFERMGTKSVWRILFGMVLTVFAFTQDRPEACQSNLQVAPGNSTVIDCVVQTEGYMYEWTSRDPSWPTYLSDVGITSPWFHAPVRVETPWQLAYDRLAFDGKGELVEIPCTRLYSSGEVSTYRVVYPDIQTVKGGTG